MNSKTLASGGVCVLIGAGFALVALRTLAIGELTHMGPGFFPLVLAVILMGVGVSIALAGLREGPAEPWLHLKQLPWRGIALLMGALLLFGAVIRPLGLGPAVFLVSMVSAYSSRKQTHLMALTVSILLAVFCSIMFGMVLRLPIPIIGPWLRF